VAQKASASNGTWDGYTYGAKSNRRKKKKAGTGRGAKLFTGNKGFVFCGCRLEGRGMGGGGWVCKTTRKKTCLRGEISAPSG